MLLVLVSALAWSTAGLFTKGSAADAWAVLFWRGLFAGGFMLAYLEIVGRERLWPGCRQLGLSGWMALSISTAATFAFLNAFKLTSIANVTLIYAAIPFAAGGLGWLLLRERPPRAILLASLVALAGVGPGGPKWASSPPSASFMPRPRSR